jgi:hypothetical protein
MFTTTRFMGDLLRKSITARQGTSWRTCEFNFGPSETPHLTPGCINIAPCWFQQGHEVGPLWARQWKSASSHWARPLHSTLLFGPDPTVSCHPWAQLFLSKHHNIMGPAVPTGLYFTLGPSITEESQPRVAVKLGEKLLNGLHRL